MKQAVIVIAVTAAVAAGSVCSAARIISINKDEQSGRVPMSPDDLAGAPGVRVSNWNNYQSATATLNGTDLVYDDGTTVGGTFQVTTDGHPHWAGPTDDINDPLMYTGAHALMSDVSQGGTLSITFTDVPFPLYDIYVYAMGQSANIRGGAITLVGGETFYTTGSSTPADDGSGYIAMTTTSFTDPGDIETGNYIAYKGLSGDQEIEATCYLWGDHPRFQVYGYQIVEVPEPQTLALFALAGAVACRRRRRARM